MSNPQISIKMRMQFGELNITPRVVSRLHDLDFTVPELEDAIAEHKSECDGEPSVYVGTYAKYNDGSLRGLWIDLTTFDDYDEFINFCKAIHADEEDPELMAQDYECFPREWYNEGFICEEDFDHIKEYWKLCEKHSVEAVDAFMGWGGESLEHFEDCYLGEYDSEEDYARQFVDDCYDLERQMGNLAYYFDYKAFARELFMYDMYFNNGHVFRHY